MMIGVNNTTIRLAYNSFSATNTAMEKTARALSTGLKAATAADDAAGFAMGQNISAQIAGVDRAIRNSQDGISMLQTAESALNQINSMLQRMRELTVQAANDSLTTQDRSYIQLEIGELRQNIDNIASNTTFNSKRLLDGSSSATWSSDDANTKLKVTGAITNIDQFGQKKHVEGNFRVEIRAKTGQGEVKKSNIFDLTVAREISRHEDPKDDKSPIIKDVVIEEATLADMQAFKDHSGAFMLREPQKITITQGNGRSADVILYGGDTLNDVRQKINDAIANDLGQGAYTDNISNFCSIASGTEGTSEAVRESEKVYAPAYDRDESDEGTGKLLLNEFNEPVELPLKQGEYVGDITKATLLIRSAVAGSAGTLTFTSENNDLINALGLSTIQSAEDNVFVASVYDAHTGKVIADNLEADGNSINGAISPNASIEFDPMANTHAHWDDNTKRYVLTADAQAYTTTIHIVDRSTAFQIGQNHGEDIYINIGDMRSEALGLTGLNVTTREKASASIHIIDAAIHKVGSQRSKVGAYQNELEYNTNSLTQTSLHLNESESRLKDADMAKEMMEFVKLQILSNTGSSMLSQANQNAQSIMSVLNQ